MFNYKVSGQKHLSSQEYNKILEQKWCEEQKRQIQQKRLYRQYKIQKRQNKKLMKINQYLQGQQQQKKLIQIKELERIEKRRKIQCQLINKMKDQNEKFNKFVEEQKITQKKVIKEKNLQIRKQINIGNTKTGEKKIKVKAKLQTEKKQQKKDENNVEYSFKDMKPLQIWQKIQNIEQKSAEISHLICEEVMNEPVTETQLKVSQSIKKSLKEKASQNPQSVENLVFKVAEELQKCGVPIVMSQHSTVQSQISLKALTQGFMQNAIKVTETIPDNHPNCPFTFDELENPQQFNNFSTFYKMKIAKQTGLDPSRIYISSVIKGSIKVEWTTDDSDKLKASFETQPELEKKLKIHKFFQYFHLSPEDFDPRGNIQFNESKNDVQTRGGWPYYQPIKCKRYGINVSKKYDNGDDTWLMMNGKPGEWAVAFHGVKAPKAFQTNQPKTLNLIMQGRQTNSMLKAFGGQAYKDFNSMNKPNQRVGVGIYCTPHIQITFSGYIDTSDEYALIFQCRVNPKQIKVCNYEPYWVINDTKNIRPYGIILLKNKIVSQYPSIDQQFGTNFSYINYQGQIEKYINSY